MKAPHHLRSFYRVSTILVSFFCLHQTPAKEQPSKLPPPPQIDIHPGTIIMQTYEVAEEPPPLSFGLKLSVWRDNNTNKVMRIYIDQTSKGSDAKELNLGPRTRIYHINGQPVEELVASFNNDTVLHDVFIDRDLGDKVTLEILREHSLERETVVLTEKPKIQLQATFNFWDRSR